MSGEGIEDALAGADVIVHCATGAADSGVRGLGYKATLRTDVQPTRALLEAARKSGGARFVYPSIVGVDKIPLGYYRGKLDCERAIGASGLPYTIVRSTQWHTLAWEFCRRLTAMPIVLVPKGVRSQLLDPGEIAERIASLIESGVEGHAPEMGGPAALDFCDIVQSYLQATGKRRIVAEVPVPGKAVDGFRAGYNLTPEHADGRITWEQWLAENAATN